MGQEWASPTRAAYLFMGARARFAGRTTCRAYTRATGVRKSSQLAEARVFRPQARTGVLDRAGKGSGSQGSKSWRAPNVQLPGSGCSPWVRAIEYAAGRDGRIGAGSKIGCPCMLARCDEGGGGRHGGRDRCGAGEHALRPREQAGEGWDGGGARGGPPRPRHAARDEAHPLSRSREDSRVDEAPSARGPGRQRASPREHRPGDRLRLHQLGSPLHGPASCSPARR